jgi:hypothetical protein
MSDDVEAVEKVLKVGSGLFSLHSVVKRSSAP